jgi:predicted RNA-binding Zn-ribbon protein involved in translation (DUF1610 family)
VAPIENKARCPICGLFMKSFRTYYWRDMKLSFPYNIYRCEKHGIYLKLNDEYELVNFSTLQSNVEKQSLPNNVNVQWFDPTIVNMKCPVCGEKWIQYEEFPSRSYGGVVFCPNNHSVEKDMALIHGSIN